MECRWNCSVLGRHIQDILAQRGTKSVYEVGGRCRIEYTTVLGCGSADGVKLPPLVYNA